MNKDQVIEHELNYIKEEYRDDFINDDENEPYIKFSPQEFEDFCRFIITKSLQKHEETNNPR